MGQPESVSTASRCSRRNITATSGASVFRVAMAFVLRDRCSASPIGVLMGWSRIFYGLTFPLLEMLRPIPILAWIPLAILLLPGPRAADHRTDLPRRVFRDDPQYAARCEVDRRGLFPRRALARLRRMRHSLPRHHSGRDALHLRRPADRHGRVLVLAGRVRDRLRPGRARLQGLGDLLLRAVRDHGHRHGDARACSATSPARLFASSATA